jgi:signal transduction histidine kinase
MFGADVAPWPVALVALFPLIGTYIITRRKNTTGRMVASELFIITLWYIFLMRAILADSLTEFVLEVGVLGASVVFGVLLIRNVHKETEIRERGERLARYLANANARLRELDKQKTEFVSLASHQLRGPIAAIVGYVSLIQEGSYGSVPDHLKEPLSRIFESGKRISLMVDDFLNVTRIEQGRMSYRFVTCDIAPLVSRAVDEFRVLAEKKGLTITFVPSPDGQVLARVDETKFVQVLQNLIDNAVKFTVSGSITVSVRSNERRTKALVTVADTGIGIAPEEVHNLSHKFSRASNANSVSVYGSGLGLYISKEILKAHDGWIYISSAGVGKGSVFTVELPIERGEKME